MEKVDTHRISDWHRASLPGVRQIPARSSRTWSADRILTLQFFALIYLQKLAVPLPASTQIGLSMVCFFLLLVPGLMEGVYRLSISRLLLFGIFAFCAILSQASVTSYSVSSLALLLVLYGAMTLTWSCTKQEHIAVCENVSLMMLLPAAAVFVQYLYEAVHGTGVSLSIESFIPQAFLVKGYMYETSTAHWVTWNRPNGLFFLEPSYCSAFLALAAINDWHILRRNYRAIFFVAALAATNGATGMLMLAIAIVTLGLMRRPLTTGFVALLGVVASTIIGSLASSLPLLSRLGELNNANSSGYGRLLLPFNAAVKLISDPDLFFHGVGAGKISVEYGSAWPIAKLALEYGTLTAVSYFIFICVCMYGRVNVPLLVALFVVFQFTGAYLLNPVMTNLIILCCAGHIMAAENRPRSRLENPQKHIAFRNRAFSR